MIVQTALLDQFLLARVAEEEAAWREGGALVTRPEFARFSRHMLADCNAKRRIVEEHQPTRQHPDEIAAGYALRCSVCAIGPFTMHRWPCPTLRMLAISYAEHPDFQLEWTV